MEVRFYDTIKKILFRTNESIPSDQNSLTPEIEQSKSPDQIDLRKYRSVIASSLKLGSSTTLDSIVANVRHNRDSIISSSKQFHPTDLNLRLVDNVIINQLHVQNVKLNNITVDSIGFTPGVLRRLKKHKIYTIDQLCSITKKELLSLRSIGITRASQIQSDLNLFLNSLVNKTEEKSAKQLSLKSINPQNSDIQKDLIQPLIDSLLRLRDIFSDKVNLERTLFPSNVWADFLQVLGKEPISFDDLVHSFQVLHGDIGKIYIENYISNHAAIKRISNWIERAIIYECLDDEVSHIVDKLNERERLILLGRYKIERPLTLDMLGNQFGITRERVRQIQLKVKKKLTARLKYSTLLYSNAALCILKEHNNNVTLAIWTQQLIDFGFVRNSQSIELMLAVAIASNSKELVLPENLNCSIKTSIPQQVIHGAKPILEKARKMCRNCGVVRTLSLVDETIEQKDVEQILGLNGYSEISTGWWTKGTGDSVLERVTIKVSVYCGAVSPSELRYALTRHLSRAQLAAPPSEIMSKVLSLNGKFLIKEGLVQLVEPPAEQPSLTGPEKIFLGLFQSEGPILSFDNIHHKLLEEGLSSGSVTSLLRYSPIIRKITTSLYSVLGAKYNELDIQEAQNQLTRISANSTLKIRSDGVIEFELNAGSWLEYGGVLSSGPAASLKGVWKLINNEYEPDQLIIDGGFIRGLSRISKSLGIVSGDRIRIEFNTWTREAKMIKVVKDE